MAPIRRIAGALVVAGALSLPGLAAAEQPTELCDGDKMKEPTAEKSEPKQGEKTSKKTDDKSEQKRDAKEAEKPDSV
jgi:hypothetical protein